MVRPGYVHILAVPNGKAGDIMHTILSALLAITLLFGTQTEAPVFAAPEYLITEIEISCSSGIPARQHLTDQQQITRILLYLQSVEIVTEEAAPSPPEPCYLLTLTHSTGRITVYQQQGDRLLSKNGGPWQNLDPEQGKQLPLLCQSSI